MIGAPPESERKMSDNKKQPRRQAQSEMEVETEELSLETPIVTDRKVPDTVTRTLRGAQLLVQDVFKLQVANRLFNMSWKKARPQLIEQEHCHFFRSVNDQGIPNEYSTAIGGHFHKVDVEWEADGKTLKSVKCGPPLHKAQITGKGSMRKINRIVQVAFEKEDEHGDIHNMPDNHTHELKYLYTDHFTIREREAARQEESLKVRSLMQGNVKPQAAPAPAANE